MIIESAYALADYTAEHYLQDHLQDKKIYPPISDLQSVSMFITKRVLGLMIKEGMAAKEGIQQSNIDALIRENAWKAEYLPFVVV